MLAPQPKVARHDCCSKLKLKYILKAHQQTSLEPLLTTGPGPIFCIAQTALCIARESPAARSHATGLHTVHISYGQRKEFPKGAPQIHHKGDEELMFSRIPALPEEDIAGP